MSGRVGSEEFRVESSGVRGEESWELKVVSAELGTEEVRR
jgi:hypothetical protein